MQLVFVSRLLEAFFRRWWLYLLPVLIFGALGVASVAQRSTKYWSVGIVRVSSQSLLQDLTQIGDTNQIGFETPADYASREINAVLGTDLFVESVIERAGIVDAVESGVLTYDDLRESIWASAGSDLLVEVNATSYDPELARRLAKSTIDSYLQWQIDDSVTDSSSAARFFETLLGSYQQRYDTAQADLEEYLAAHPGPSDLELRPVDEQFAISQRTSAVTRADEQLSNALKSLADARLAAAQTETDVSLRIRTIDEPQLPTEPVARKVQDATTVAVMLILGSIVAAALVAVSALLDRSVRYSDEAEDRLELPVLAVVPSSSTRLASPVL